MQINQKNYNLTAFLISFISLFFTSLARADFALVKHNYQKCFLDKDKDEKNIVEENNEKYTVVTLSDKREIKIRHPKGRDVRFMMSGGGQNDSDLLFRLTSNFTCLSEEELENMEAKDCTMLLKEVSSFLE